MINATILCTRPQATLEQEMNFVIEEFRSRKGRKSK